MKKTGFMFYMVAILMAGLLFSQMESRKSCEEFIQYLTQNQEQLQYKEFSQQTVNHETEVRVTCQEITQKQLIDAIKAFASDRYFFQKTDSGEIAFYAYFPQSTSEATTSKKSADSSAKPTVRCPGRIKVNVEQLKPERFDEYMTYRGSLTVPASEVKAPIPGTIKELKIAEGDVITTESTIMVIQGVNPDELKQVKSEVDKAKQTWIARKNWKVPSEKAVAQAEKRYNELLSQYQRLKEKVAVPIVSPMSGIVKKLHVAMDQVVNEGDPLALIKSDKIMDADIEMNPDDVSLFNRDERLPCNILDGNEKIEGEVADVNQNALRIRFENLPMEHMEGKEIEFHKLRKSHENACVISRDWLLKDEIGHYVFVVDVREARQIYITPGPGENSRMMILQGLTPDFEIITSGYECLKDGKKIRAIRPAGVKPTPKVTPKEKVEKPVSPEKPVQETQPAPKVSWFAQKNFRVGFLFGRFFIEDKNLTDYYPHKWKNIPAIELSVHTKFNLDLWASYKVYSDETETPLFKNTAKFKINPFFVGIRYRPDFKMKSKRFEPFVGAGLNFYSFSETIEGDTRLENTEDTATGYHIQAGTYIEIFRSVLGEIFARYNIVNKTITGDTPDEMTQLKLGGWEFGLGIVFRF